MNVKNNSKPTVCWASAHVSEIRVEATLPAKFERLLEVYPFEKMFKDKQVAVKMHIGAGMGYTTIHPIFLRILIKKIIDAGGKPFVTDGSFSVSQAVVRGYTEEVLGCPIYPAAGIANKYYYTKKLNYRALKTVELCGNIIDADAMIVFSHGKGHGHSGFGGAIKNVAMGCVAGDSRGKIHRLMESGFEWDAEKCDLCYLCRDNCPGDAISFNDEGKLSIFDHHCHYCMHCTAACPTDAISIDQSGYKYFQRGMALTTKAVVENFEQNRLLYINVLTNITPLCDCWGLSTPSIVPDVGIVSGTDIVATEWASLDLIKAENLIPGSLPDCYELSGKGHLFEQIHPGKDPYLQVKMAEKVGLGSRNHRIKEIS
jgi:uncharacterized Fe-S center protein